MPWDLTARSHDLAPLAPLAPRPDARWKFDGGMAWIYLGSGNETLAQPVILSDGFHLGSTNVNTFWQGLELDPTGFPFASAIRDSHHDLIILGYEDCTASILKNADVAIACVKRAITEARPGAKLAVGGFSMGGLITRYALAAMETIENFNHQTALYVSYDSPHLGAWIPISIQALAHVIGVVDRTLADLVDSPAARELLRFHLPATLDTANIGWHEDREIFLQALHDVGSWPQRLGLRRIGVANGMDNGKAVGLPPGGPALRSLSGDLAPTTLYLQASGDDRLVAELRTPFGGMDVKTSGLPQADGAPGGRLESFGLVADELQEKAGEGTVECNQRWVSFIPTGSAIAVAGLGIWDNLYADVSEAASDLDAVKCASQNGAHTSTDEGLCTWIVEQLP